MHGTPKKSVVVLVILCFISTPIVSAGYSDWSLTVPINPDDDGVTAFGFSVPNDETVTDAWINVDSEPMANSPSNVYREVDGLSGGTAGNFTDGTMTDSTVSVFDNHLTLAEEGSVSNDYTFDDTNYSAELTDSYFYGPGNHVFSFENGEDSNGNLIGYENHPSCDSSDSWQLTGYNFSAGVDHNSNQLLDLSEVEFSAYLCQTDQVIVDGSGGFVDFNGTLQNGTFRYFTTSLPLGDTNCPNGGTHLTYGTDYAEYYDSNYSINATETQGDYLLCDPSGQDLWHATTLNLNGVITGDEQQLAHGIVPAYASQGRVAVGTNPGGIVSPGTDSWFSLPSFEVPLNSSTHVNYYLSFDHWYDIESGDGVWVEHRLKQNSEWGNWTWTSLNSREPVTGDYPDSISESSIMIEGNPSGGLIPVFGGDPHSGWISTELNVANISMITLSSDVQFRFRIHTSATSLGSSGWFIDNIQYHNDGNGIMAWHHGCDINANYYTNHGTYCGYAPSQYGALEHSIDLSGVDSIQFDVHWDLEGSSWDNACIELSDNAGTSWIDITSASSGTGSDCSSRSNPIPGLNGYSDMDGNHYNDDSWTMVTIEKSVPSTHQVPNALIRYVVDTDSIWNAGNTQTSNNDPDDPDGREGFSVFGYRTYNTAGSLIDTLEYSSTQTSSPAFYSPPNTGGGGGNGGDWQHISIGTGYLDELHAFEDSTVSAPDVDDVNGFSRTTTISNCDNIDCEWQLTNILSDDFGPQNAATFPYLYSIGANGFTVPKFEEISLFTPLYDVPNDGHILFTFDQWICAAYSGSYGNYRGSALFIEVDGGDWEHVNPGNWYSETMPTYSQGTSYISTVVDGYDIWTGENCNTDDYTNFELPLSEWSGSEIRFKFSMGGKYSGSSTSDVGWFVDNVGFTQLNFKSTGNWVSEPIDMSGTDSFNHGIIELEGKVADNSSLSGTIIDDAGNGIIGFENLDFPINLAGFDSYTYPSVQLRLDLASSDLLSTPLVNRIHIGGPRILSAELFDFNGWDIPDGVEVINGTLNATTVSRTITSDFIESVRPINRLNFVGDASNNVAIEIFDNQGLSLGIATHGGFMIFSEPIMGYSVEITLLPNAFIERMAINHIYGEPARDIVVDVAEDGQSDWAFPYSSGFGHLGWQTNILQYSPSSPSIPLSPMTSIDLQLDAGVSETVFLLIPEGSVVNSGLIALTSDSDGFDAPIEVTINGYQESTSSSDMYLSYLHMSPNQVASMMAFTQDTLTDSTNDRVWKEVNIELESSVDQSITLSRIAVSYSIIENVSGLDSVISTYHDSAVIANPSLPNIFIPTNITAPYGQIFIDGRVLHELMITNKAFTVPNTFYPDGVQSEIITTHRHLYDNSEIVKITLEAVSSEGDTIIFSLDNGADGSWGQNSGSDLVNFYQSSGSELSTLDTSSSHVNIIDGGDGWMDVEVTWAFDTSWNWDDVDSIDWYSNATNSDAEYWPVAHAESGISGKAVENDLVIESVLIKDSYDRVISNPSSPYYPYAVRTGSLINVSGIISFEGSNPPVFPQAIDFVVSGNISDSSDVAGHNLLHPLTSMANGEFYGQITVSSSDSSGFINAELTRVGPISGSNGAQSLGVPEVFSYVIDSNPPGLGPINIQSSSGLTPAIGEVWDPDHPLDVYVTVSDYEAIGEILTLHYWREGVDDDNGDEIADEVEYQNISYNLNSGFSGDQQVIFNGFDLDNLEFNAEVHFWLEGTDWSGLSYQDGMRGGGPGAENSWSYLVIAEDIEASIVKTENAFSLDSELGYLLAGNTHNFKMQINEPNGIRTIDSVTIMLCGLRMDDNLGEFYYSPTLDELSTSDDSMVTPHSVSINQVSTDVIELSFMFEISWNFPWSSGDNCKIYVKFDDGSVSDEYNVGNNIQEMTWHLDNVLTALPLSAEDLTPPHVTSQGNEIFLREGDEYSLSGTVNSPVRVSIRKEIAVPSKAVLAACRSASVIPGLSAR